MRQFYVSTHTIYAGRNNMLSHKYRFHGHGSLRYLHRNGRVARSRHLLVKFVTNTRRDESRFAVVVGKKVVKSAVKRNRIRRRIFEIVRKNWQHIRQNRDVVITVYSPELLVMSADEIERMVIGTLTQADVYSKTPVRSDIVRPSL